MRPRREPDLGFRISLESAVVVVPRLGITRFSADLHSRR